MDFTATAATLEAHLVSFQADLESAPVVPAPAADAAPRAVSFAAAVGGTESPPDPARSAAGTSAAPADEAQADSPEPPLDSAAPPGGVSLQAPAAVAALAATVAGVQTDTAVHVAALHDKIDALAATVEASSKEAKTNLNTLLRLQEMQFASLAQVRQHNASARALTASVPTALQAEALPSATATADQPSADAAPAPASAGPASAATASAAQVYVPEALLPPPPLRATASALPVSRPPMSGLSIRDALQLLTPFYGNADRTSEVVDVSQFLAMQRWFEQSLFKLRTAGVPRENQAMLLCQKLEGPAHAAFRSQCLAQDWDMAACSPELLLHRLTQLFPHAETALTKQLNDMTFSAATMVSDLQVFRQCARHSSWKRMLDHNPTIYQLVRDKMEAAKSRCLGDVNSQHGLRLDDNLSFDAFINRAAEIAYHVQMKSALPASAKGTKTATAATPAPVASHERAAKKPRTDAPTAKPNNLKAAVVKEVDEQCAAWRVLPAHSVAAKCADVIKLNHDPAALLTACGRCPDCAFWSASAKGIANHHCDPSARKGRLGKVKEALQNKQNPNAALAATATRSASRG